MNKKFTREELKEALDVAKEQADCYAAQVCGCWSIDGKTFCEKYGLSDDAAYEAQENDNDKSFLALYREKEYKIRRAIGDLTESQLEKLEEHVHSECYQAEYDVAYWDNVADQIKDKLYELAKEENEGE